MAIEIIIREDGTTTNGTQGTTSQPNAPRGTKEEQGKPKANHKAINALLIDYGKQLVLQGVNVSIDYSGDNLLRDEINTAANIATDILAIAEAGWFGVAATAVKYGTNALNNFLQLDRSRYTSQVLRQQAGKIVELGGRYTND